MRNLKSFVGAFFIGAVAGCTPFLCMTYLPLLLSPEGGLRRLNFVALWIVSAIVGLVTAIMYHRDLPSTSPKEVFIYALGIPALLIGTVSTIAQKAETLAVADRANLAISAPAPGIKQEPGIFQEAIPSSTGVSQGSWLPLVPEAWADPQSQPQAGVSPVADTGFFVVLGQFATVADATKEFNHWQHDGEFKTERYFPKHLKLYKVVSSKFYVSYTGMLTKDEALRLFKLLRINDPQLSPEIVEKTRDK